MSLKVCCVKFFFQKIPYLKKYLVFEIGFNFTTQHFSRVCHSIDIQKKLWEKFSATPAPPSTPLDLEREGGDEMGRGRRRKGG
jgi:hypothetical protein